MSLSSVDEKPLLKGLEEKPRDRPDGGFRLIRVASIVAIWFAYRQRRISLSALRAWAALHEMVERRKAYFFSEKRAGRKLTKPSHYRVGELARLMGVPMKAAEKALKELTDGGYVDFAPELVRFTPPDKLPWTEEFRSEFDEFFAAYFRNPRREVPVARRTLVLLAEVPSAPYAWSLLAYTIRCCWWYSKTSEYRYTGTVKSSWVAATGGFSERWAKKLRGWLTQIGWLKKIGSSQRSMNRVGECFEVSPTFEAESKSVAVNPAFDRLAGVTDATPEAGQTPAPVSETGVAAAVEIPATSEAQSSQPPGPAVPTHRQNNSNFLETTKNQDTNKRNSGRGPEPGPGVCQHQVEGRRPQDPGHGEKLPAARISSIKPFDLASLPRLLELHRQYVAAGVLNGSQHERLLLVAAAEKCRHLPPDVKSPCAVFNRIINGKLWTHLSEGQIDAARVRLREWEFGPLRSGRTGTLSAVGQGGQTPPAPAPPAAEPPRKSKDAVLLQMIKNQAGLRDLEAVWNLVRTQLGWSRAQFVQAKKRSREGRDEGCGSKLPPAAS